VIQPLAGECKQVPGNQRGFVTENKGWYAVPLATGLKSQPSGQETSYFKLCLQKSEIEQEVVLSVPQHKNLYFKL
jgi:hypothetical protein